MRVKVLISATASEGGMSPGIAFNISIAGHKIPVYNFVITSWVIMLLLVIVSILATRNMKKIPSGIQNVVEFAVEGIVGFFGSIMGERNIKKYLPLIGTFFLFILISNYSGLLPGMGMVKGMQAPTSTLNVTAALAIIVFFTVHGLGIKTKGLGYFKHFFKPMAFMFILHVIDSIVLPVSLSLRLFGNIFGEETLGHQLGLMVPQPFTGLLAPLPIMLLGLLLGAIQAAVFTLLAANFIGDAIEEHH